MNWFQRHINLSLTIWWIGGLFLILIAIPNITAYWRMSGDGNQAFLWFFLLYPIILLIIDAWVLRQKGRSLFYLFFILLGIAIGQIIFLVLANKREQAARQAPAA